MCNLTSQRVVFCTHLMSGVQLIAKSETEIGWMSSLGSLHSPLALLFVALVIGHIVAALYHHYIKRDDTLRRMLG